MSKYIELNISDLDQITNKSMYIGTLFATDIFRLVKYSNRTSLPIDPFNKKNEDLNNEDKSYYQRVKKSDRAYDIKLFLLKNIYHKYNFKKRRVSPLGVFPSAIILSLKTFSEADGFSKYLNYLDEESKTNVVDLSFINESKSRLYIPITSHALIVDGQHRIAGFEALFKELTEGKLELKKKHSSEYFIKSMPPIEFILNELRNFKFIVTFLLDYDLYEQGEIFAKVNFNQKPVNKSFYYDIFGSISKGRSIEKLLHEIVAHLNYNVDSKLYGYIKMLGTGPGFISQAFLVEALYPLFNNGIFSEILIDFIDDGEDYVRLPKFFRAYFAAFTKKFHNFLPPSEGKYNDILIKTTGMGAIILLIPYIHSKLKEKITTDILDMDEKDLESNIDEIITPIEVYGEDYFSERSEFSKSAGLGLQSKLYNKILSDLKKPTTKK